MSNTSKNLGEVDANQTLMLVYNPSDASISTADKWVQAIIGRTITNVITTTSSTGDTVTSTYTEGSNTLFVIKTIYVDNTYKMMLSQTRLS